ncbi:unnamed protein product [Oikopleura dioica]|uniref:ZP domain-containing protein n=1 Tax=Oikopleura dioica TaxID=34765 RepID=E4XXH0_OIKDI|nr:unnamed protein product [Oikopleura dioica]
MTVPKGYMDEMAQGMNNNGVLHMCQDNSYLCDFVDACKFRLEGEYFVFDSCSVENRACNQIEIERDGDESFYATSTVVWDRQASFIRMPRPLKEVTCKVIINLAEASLFPSVANPMSVDDKPVEIVMTLWKTKFGIWPGITATKAQLPNGELSYIIGEVIHARIQPVLPLRRTVAFDGEEVDFNLNSCWLASPNDPSIKYLIISENAVVADPIVPVEIEYSPTSYIGQDFEYNSKRALAFNFQVAIFRNGDPMKLICETSFKFDTVKVISGSRKRRETRQQQKEVSPSDIFTTNAEFAVYKNSTLPLKEGLFGVENSDVSELEALREIARISNRAEVRAVVQPGAYLSETLPKTKNLTLEDIQSDINNGNGWITIETLLLLPLLSVLIIAARMYRTYSILNKCAHFINGKILHKKAIFEKAEIKEEYHPRSELTTQSSFDDETIHFSHDDKIPILPK